jgi:hypothetical protein
VAVRENVNGVALKVVVKIMMVRLVRLVEVQAPVMNQLHLATDVVEVEKLQKFKEK